MNPPSNAASEAAEKIIHLLGVGHVRDIDFTIDRACRAYAARQNAELRGFVKRVTRALQLRPTDHAPR